MKTGKKIATIGYDSIHKQDLQNICKSLGMKQGEFFESAIEYFRKTGIDPRMKSGDFKTDLDRSANRVIGFIKTQDKLAQEHFQILTRKIETGSNTELWEAMTQINKNMTAVVEVCTQLLENK